jgi:hypothetical protein
MAFATIRPTNGEPERSAVLNFLRDATNNNISPAEQEWRAMESRFPSEMEHVYDHVQLVEACQSLNSNPLRQATPVSTAPDMFW